MPFVRLIQKRRTKSMEQTELLIIRYLTGELSQEERILLLSRLEADEERRKYFRSLKDAYDLGRLEVDMKDSRMKSQWNKFARMIRKTDSVGIWKSTGITLLRYAAVFMLGICASSIYPVADRFAGYVRREDERMAETKIETGVGDKSKILLPDGSTVWLNACSSILYGGDMTGDDERSVYLKGEAYFVVKTDMRRPFLVRTDGLTYRVTGTSFNVYAFEEEDVSSVALLDGGVSIVYDNRSHSLCPGELFVYNKVTREFTVKKADVNLLSSWRRGEFVFDNMTFEELVNRLQRLYNVEFVFENEKIRKETFGGTLRDFDSLETIMNVIQTSIPIKYKIEENKVFIR
jgi:ferric-dicitrate binding protein FerR (iron transport regulator)